MAPSPAKPRPDDARLREDAQALHVALSDLVRLYQFRDRDRICCHDISVTQCHALEVLVEQGARRSQMLSSALRLDKSTTTRVVDALVRKGYVERTPDTEDRRAVSLRATAAGKRLYHRINDELVESQQALIADLPAETRRASIELIRRLARSAEARFVAGSACAPDACEPGDGAASRCS